LAPENLTTLAHFSVSSTMELANAADGIGAVSPPTSVNRALSVASARPAVMLALKLIVDDRCGRGLWRTDSVPRRRLESRQDFADRGNIRQCAGPRRSSHGQRLHLAGPDWTNRRRHSDDEGLDLSAKQIREGRRRTAIGHVNEIEAGHQFQKLGRHMHRRSDAGRSDIDLAGIGLGHTR